MANTYFNREALEHAIESKGFTQEELSRKLDRSDNYMSETIAKGWVNDRIFLKLCKILEINKDYLVVQKVENVKNSSKSMYSYAHSESKYIKRNKKSFKEKRKLSPEETQKWIEEHRTESDEVINAKINDVLTKAVVVCGVKKYIHINPVYVNVATEIQRELDMLIARGLAESFDENLYDPIKVAFISGKLYVVDGNHRLIACILRGEGLTQMELLNVGSVEEAANIFAAQTAGRKNPTVADLYRAEIIKGNEEMKTLRDVFQNKNNIQITEDAEKLNNPAGYVRPSRSLIRLINRNKDLLEKIITLLKDIGWNGGRNNVFKITVFNAIIKMVSNYGEERVFKALRENVNGAQFYDGILAQIYTQSALYDKIVELSGLEKEAVA